MKILIGLMLTVLGAALGIYVGLYVCLYWGIMDAITAFSDPVNTSAGVWAIIRALFFELGGGLAAMIPMGIGMLLMTDD